MQEPALLTRSRRRRPAVVTTLALALVLSTLFYAYWTLKAKPLREASGTLCGKSITASLEVKDRALWSHISIRQSAWSWNAEHSSTNLGRATVESTSNPNIEFDAEHCRIILSTTSIRQSYIVGKPAQK